MTLKNLVTCDVCNKEFNDFYYDQKKEYNYKDIKISKKMLTVVFLTEQNEGRYTEPYLTNQTLDICKVCEKKLIETRTLLEGAGAMGYNKYNFPNDK